MSSIMAQSFHRNILSSRKALFFQQPKRALGNSNPYPFQSLHPRYYANSSFSQEGFTIKFLDKELAKLLRNLIITSIIGGFAISVDLLYASHRNRHNKSLLNETLEKGTRPDVNIKEGELVSRPVIVERLKKILLPRENQSRYYVICGEHGTGKTTLARIASREVGQNKKKGIQGGRGVIYVDVPADIEEFGVAFGEALNFTFEERISVAAQLRKKLLGDINNESEPKWKRAMKAFKRASIVYKKNNPCHQPPVIVYDNISRLIHKNPEIIDILQDDAKDNADNRRYIAVFVSSEGLVPKRMESRSAWSRADKPVIEIGDLNEEDSIKYLVDVRKIKKEEAKTIYDLVGGRIVDLQYVADKFLAGVKFEVIKKNILYEAEKKIQIAQLGENQQLHEVGKNVISALLNSKELDYLEFRKQVDQSKKMAKEFDPDELLEKNVFAYHPENNTVTFQSQSVKNYILEKKNIFGIEKQNNVKSRR